MKKNRDGKQTLRLTGYDYSNPGYYFVTICTKNREKLFARKVESPYSIQLTEHGKLVQYTWFDLINHIEGIALDEFIIMPDHIHGIIHIFDNPLRKIALPEIVRQFKTFSAKRINELRLTPGTSVWQRNYYEHIVRNQESLNRIRRYIRNNPLQLRR